VLFYYYTKRERVLVIWCIFGIILLIISVNDFLFFRIENENIQCLIILYIISYIVGVSGSSFIFGLLTSIAGFVIALILNRYNLMGGGDVKLLFPLLLFSENNTYSFLITVSIAGIILSCIYIIFGNHIFIYRKKVISCLMNLRRPKKKFPVLNIALLSLDRISKRTVLAEKCTTSALKQEIPYGVALSCGGFCVIVENLLSR
jgi:Flp pilus assembly protein protease CpaA